jgi:WG containing repeat
MRNCVSRSLVVIALLANALMFAFISCKPAQDTPVAETEQSTVLPAASAPTRDFGPTLLKIGTGYSIYDNRLEASRWGFIDLNGKVVIEPQWQEADGFSNGYAQIKGNGKQGWIDKTGRLLPPHFSAPNFQEGLASFERDGKRGFVDTKGTVVIQPEWEEAKDFDHGYASVKRDGKWGVIDKTGRLVIPLGNYEGLDFEPELGLWRIVVNKKGGYIDRAGRVVIKPEWDEGLGWHKGFGLVARKREMKWGLIDKTGKLVVPLKWERASPFRDGVAAVRENGKWGFIDEKGNYVIEPQWEDAAGFHKGLAAVERNGKWGFIDKTNKVVIELRWEEVGDLGRELILVRENKKCGFIDRSGRMVIEPQWDVADYYWETQFDMSGHDGNEPIYWLVAREEKPEPGQAQSKPIVRVLWLDSAGKQIWSSDNSNSSTAKDALKSLAPSVSPGQDNH